MSNAVWLLLLSQPVLVAGLLVAERVDSAPGRWATKVPASSVFVAVGVLRMLDASGSAPAPAWRWAILVGLGACWVGDVLLIPRHHVAFLAGIGAFLLGHVLFAVGFGLLGVSWVAVALAAGPLLGLAWRVDRWLAPHAGELLVPVRCYIVAIVSMVALAIGTIPGAEVGPTLAAAAMAFMVSDLSVAQDRLVSPHLVHRLWGLPLYFASTTALAILLG